MHEMSICRNLLDTLARSAVEKGFQRILRVRLQIGVLAAIDAEALRFSFEVAARGTQAEGASLLIEQGLAQAHCLGCGHEFACADYLASCPRCGGERLRLSGGDEMRISELEVE